MIIGSYALKHHFPEFKREPKDIDVVEDIMYISPDNIRIEFLKNPVLTEYYGNSYPYIIGKNELYTLKISHSFWDLPNKSWEKHMWDIQFMKERGCNLIKPLFDKLYEYWNKIHGNNKRSDLKMSGEDFFDNAINFSIKHDDLHEILIKHSYFNQDKPTYTKILKDGAEVEVDENKFNLLTEQEKYNLVIEEIMCMAIERYNKLYYKAAFEKMLKKFILSHAPIWEAIWIIENHKKLMQTIPFDFIKYFKDGIK